MTSLRVRRHLLAGVLGLAAACGALTALPASADDAPPAAGRTITVTPAEITTPGNAGPGTLAAKLASLRAGDTLVLAPGTYDVGYTRPILAKGTKDAPITVTAEVPEKTLIRGLVKLFDADYWVLRKLRVRAAVPGFEALYMGGGVGWTVWGSEFLGARGTGAYSNVTIASGTPGNPSPTGFRFTGNCVHGAARMDRKDPGRINTDHEIYVNFAGSPTTGGSVDHNVMFDHPNGVGVKLGFSGSPGALGPWNVRVTQNTIVSGGRQILLHANVRNNLISGNLIGWSTKRFMKDPRTTALYANMLTTSTNVYAHNYVFGASMVAYDPAKRFVSKGDNTLRPAPRFTSTGNCNAYRTTTPTPYGRYGTARF